MRKLLLVVLAGWLLFAGFDWLTEQERWSPPQGGSAEIGSSPALVVPGVEVRDLDGRVAWRGDVDLGPVLARIERGQRDPHRNDGGVFHNRERRLPQRPSGYYREYVIRTPGIGHAGPQRLVVGRDGELFYTSDHYRSFRRVR
ncbi:MAG: ribonuclease domain-containing protein [Wenzhouxiangella sp.]|nr:ribonuclease domain-containing protein [Wenzhouxiangella sp.]